MTAGTTTPETMTEEVTPIAAVIRHFSVVGLVSLATGLVVGGAGGRLFMRIAAILAPDHAQGLRTDAGFIVGEIGIGTVFFVVFVGLTAGLVGAVLYLVAEPWIGWAGRWRGLLFGAVLLAVAARPSDALGTDNRDFVILGEPLPLVLMIAGLFVAFGVLLVILVDATARRHDVAATPLVPHVVIVALGGPLALFVTATLFVSEDACGCEVPTAASWWLLGLAGLSCLWWIARLFAHRWRLLELGGHAVFAMTVAVAARQTASDLASIV